MASVQRTQTTLFRVEEVFFSACPSYMLHGTSVLSPLTFLFCRLSQVFLHMDIPPVLRTSSKIQTSFNYYILKHCIRHQICVSVCVSSLRFLLVLACASVCDQCLCTTAFNFGCDSPQIYEGLQQRKPLRELRAHSTYCSLQSYDAVLDVEHVDCEIVYLI